MISLPLDDQTVVSIITKKNTDTLEIDLNQSYQNLKDSLILYITNVEVEGSYNWDQLDYNTKADIVKQYYRQTKPFSIPDIDQTMMSMLLMYKGFDCPTCGIFDRDQSVQFVNDNIKLIQAITKFLDSTLLFYVRQLSNSGIGHFNLEDCVVNEDRYAVPINSVHMLMLESYNDYMTVINPDNLVWFKPFFEMPIFDGDYIHKFMYGKDNGLSAVVSLASHQ